MRRGNIISVAALVLTLALSGGCQRLTNPGADSGTISFSTSSLQLSTGMTKGGTTIEGSTFAENKTFVVFGWHADADVVEEDEKWIFDNKEVTCGTVANDRNNTSYTPLQSWEWANNTTDYYDFIAFYYESDEPAYSKSANPTFVRVPYNATVAQYDLMAAGVCRPGSDEEHRDEIVPLTFQHLLCAVKVVVYNDSEGKDFTLKNLHFKGLVISADADLTISAPPVSKFSVNWTDLAVNTNDPLFGFNSNKLVEHGESISWPEDEIIDENIIKYYNLLVPQTLAAVSKLEMSFKYVVDENEKNSSLSLGLSTIPNETDGQLLTTWEAGYKYEYRIHIRVDGGVVVSVITTQWDEVEAQTHGIML